MPNHQKLATVQPRRQEKIEHSRPERDLTKSFPLSGDISCSSHLRWNGIYQRPQHLLSHARAQLHILVPHLPTHTDAKTQPHLQRRWLTNRLAQHQISDVAAWYDAPTALEFTDHAPAYRKAVARLATNRNSYA